MELLHQYGSLLIFITAVFGFFMAFGVGANDVSNAMEHPLAQEQSQQNKPLLLQ